MDRPFSQIDEFTPEVLEQLRRESFLAQIEMAEQVGSTSDWALDALRDASQSRAFPLLFLCDRQTSGRGRSGNAWWAGRGALTFTLVVAPPADRLPPSRWPLLSLAVGVAIVDAVQAVTGDSIAQLKWPNDVYMSGRKAAGILIEAPPHRRDLLAIGVGINVSHRIDEAPESIRNVATSLHEATGQTVTRPYLLLEALRRIEQAIYLVVEHDPWLIDRANALHMLTGKSVQLKLPLETVTGRVQEIDPDGGLVLQTESGQRRFRSGTVAAFEP
ncbi:MAG: biotin--[acetyl-CoA-carboxylase] ligase [Pirellulales bacterium]